jgi:hypothetical protein
VTPGCTCPSSWLIVSGVRRGISRVFRGMTVMPFLAHRWYLLEKAIYRIEDRLRPPRKLPPESERDQVSLPPEGLAVSVELALNSRCSSDYDGNPRKFHWGIFDRTKKLSEEQIGEIVDLAKVPRFSDGKIRVRSDHNLLTFLVDHHATVVQKRRMMVESGMQQQAVGLICSALGVGMVVKSLGKDGSAFSEDEFATVRIKLDALKPTYDGSYWSEMAPAGRSPWLSGNLPDPVRDGNKPLIATLANLRTKHEGTEKLTQEFMGQLLWAARGRTPHLYKSRPWGLTIPTWRGEQNISSVYVITDGKLAKYLNWSRHRPTHSLVEMAEIDRALWHRLKEAGLTSERGIVIGRNEAFGRSLWEVGYQLLNILVQARALDIPYEAAILDENQGRVLGDIGIADPVAIILL